MGCDEQDLLEYYSAHFSEELIDLSASNPPPAELRASGASFDEADFAYTPPRGAETLRTAIAARYRAVHPDQVVLTCGASEALAALAFTLLTANELAVVEPGAYPSFTRAAATHGARVATLTGEGPLAGSKVVLLSNPTAGAGRLVDLWGWATRAREAGALLVVDEVYRELSLDGARIEAAVDVDPAAISVGDLSKPLGLGGLRIGWIACRDEALLVQLDRQVQLLSGGPPSPSVALAEQAFADFDARVGEVVRRANENASDVYAVLDAFGWRFEHPGAGLTVLARPPFDAGCQTEERVREAGFFMLPARLFGEPGGYRFSLLAEADQVREALQVASGACRPTHATPSQPDRGGSR